MRQELLTQARLIIVDDEADQVTLLTRILRQEGFQWVEGFTDPLEVAGRLKTLQADLFLVDLLMPGMDGIELIQKIRFTTPENEYLPVLALTGRHADKCKHGALASGAHDFLFKPIDWKELSLRVNSLLETRFLHRRLQAKQERLAASESSLADAQERARMGSWELDIASGQTTWSAEMYRLYQRDPALGPLSLDGVLMYVYRDDLDIVTRGYAEAVNVRFGQGLGCTRLEFRIVQANGAIRWVAAHSQPSFDENGKVVKLAGTLQDIDERKRVEEDLKQAKDEAEQANRAKSEFLSRMSHELRTPLNAILGFGQILEGELTDPGQSESAREVLKAGRHLLQLIDEVLDVSRIDAGEISLSVEPVHVGEALEAAIGLIRPMAGTREIGLKDAPADLHVLADRQRLLQILLNFFSNAIKYSGPDQAVSLMCVALADGMIRISVRDQGEGISPEEIDKLFIPFERLGASKSRTQGVGLGLAISKRLVELMGGKIGVESTVGEGSTFWVELPVAESPIEPFARTEPPGIARAAADRLYTVLYIEDNLVNLKLVERIIGLRFELRMLAAMQGSRGLELARQHQPDLILLDLHLPDIDGGEVLRRLKAAPETRAIPVVMLSADGTAGQRERFLAAGARAYLTKPLDVRKFLEVIVGAVKSAPAL
jgi:signal transduction histidine kinase